MLRPESLLKARVTHRLLRYWGYVEGITRVRGTFEDPTDTFGLRIRVGPTDVRIASPARLRFDSRVELSACPACARIFGPDFSRCPDCGLPVCPAGECGACGCAYLAP